MQVQVSFERKSAAKNHLERSNLDEVLKPPSICPGFSGACSKLMIVLVMLFVFELTLEQWFWTWSRFDFEPPEISSFADLQRLCSSLIGRGMDVWRAHDKPTTNTFYFWRPVENIILSLSISQSNTYTKNIVQNIIWYISIMERYQRMDKVGEGTYGVVYKVICKKKLK